MPVLAPVRVLPVLIVATLLGTPCAARGAGAPASVPGASQIARALDAYVARLVARDQLSGQLLVAGHGETLFERNWGFADWELRVRSLRRRASASPP